MIGDGGTFVQKLTLVEWLKRLRPETPAGPNRSVTPEEELNA